MILQGMHLKYKVLQGVTSMLILICLLHQGMADEQKPEGNSSHMRSMAALENHSVGFTQAALAFHAADSSAMARLKSYPLYRLRVDAFRSRTTGAEK